MRKIQKLFIYINIAVFLIIALTNNPPNFVLKVIVEIPNIDIRIALMLIPVVACLVFSIALYYPSVKFLVQSNIEDKKAIDKLLCLMFSCAYGENADRELALSNLDLFCDEQEHFISQYGLTVYIKEYKNHTSAISHKPPVELTKYVLDRCSQAKCDIENYTPLPFPNIGLILSFLFSTALTVLLAAITINS